MSIRTNSSNIALTRSSCSSVPGGAVRIAPTGVTGTAAASRTATAAGAASGVSDRGRSGGVATALAGTAHVLGCSSRQVMARTWSKRSRADRVRPGPASCFALRRDRHRSKLRVTHVACPGVVRNAVSNEAWWSRSRPDRPCPSERLAATEVADLTTWSERLLSGAGTLRAIARAMPAASRAVVRAMSWFAGGFSTVSLTAARCLLSLPLSPSLSTAPCPCHLPLPLPLG